MRIRPHWEEGYMAVIGGAVVALTHLRSNRPVVSGKKMADQGLDLIKSRWLINPCCSNPVYNECTIN